MTSPQQFGREINKSGRILHSARQGADPVEIRSDTDMVRADEPQGMIEMVGDFDTGQDPFDGDQRTAAIETVAHLLRAFAARFGDLFATFHPAGIPGEAPGKGSNEAWALREAHVRLTRLQGAEGPLPERLRVAMNSHTAAGGGGRFPRCRRSRRAGARPGGT